MEEEYTQLRTHESSLRKVFALFLDDGGGWWWMGEAPPAQRLPNLCELGKTATHAPLSVTEGQSRLHDA